MDEVIEYIVEIVNEFEEYVDEQLRILKVFKDHFNI